MTNNQKYSDPLLQSLWEVYVKSPDDLDFKKYFALELFKKGELRDAYPLLLEVLELDQDLNIEKAVAEIEKSVPELTQIPVGFDTGRDHAAQVLTALEGAGSSKITFSDVAGMEAVKDAIRTDLLYPLQNPELAKAYKMKIGGGILMYGPPGCGKTYIARATAGEIDATFISVSIHEVISAWTGEGERLLHGWFEEARRCKPSVLFFDEIDAIGIARSRTSGPLRTMVNQFLTELDGIGADNSEVLVVGATNLPWEVDSALRRPGRFDRLLFVPPPDQVARKRLFELELREKPIGEIDYQTLSEKSVDFSAADITQVCDDASDRAFKDAMVTGDMIPIDQALLTTVLKETRSSALDWFGTAKNYIQFSNESGLWNDVKDYLQSRGKL